MSSKYEKSYVHEEEGTYHRREIEPIAPRGGDEKNYTTHHETSYQIVPKSPSSSSNKVKPHHSTSRTQQTIDTSDDENNFEEWTTSKRKINHKTRQVETRVSRQLLVEDGKVIADSGPQVTTRIKEDNKVEECEKEKAPKNKSKFDAIACAPEGESGSGRVLGEKKEIQRVSREVREENMQYHDERFKELTGQDVHRRALQAPHELITITDKSHHAASAPRGKMVHYSNKGKKYQDTDEILEVAKLAIDGSITKEVKRTRHHEECSEDELPDEKGEAEALREEPIATRSSRRHVDYVNDFDDTATPSESSEDEVEGDPQAIRRHRAQKQHSTPSKGRKHHSGASTRHHHEDEAFPRYEIDPLLNSLRDEDFRPISADRQSSSSGRYAKEVPLTRRDKRDSSDDYENTHTATRSNRQQPYQQRQRSPSPSYRSGAGPVEIPEEYRVNRQRLAGGRGQPRERSFSPQQQQQHHQQTRTHRTHRDQDASVQAHLTDEEVERRSMNSTNSHERQTRHLQRQSTANSSRNYYYGKPKHQRQRAPSVSSRSSSSSSSLSGTLKERQRKQGTKSRDSGFRSPNGGRPETPTSQQQIYSVSSKSKRHQQQRPTSPTESVGQRSVKTTTTTVSAGLEDRPRSRRSAQEGESKSMSRKNGEKRQQTKRKDSLDSVSLASLGASATTIRVPYRGESATSKMGIQLEEDDERRKRSRGSRRGQDPQQQQPQQQFNYRTIIANVQPVPIVPRQQVIDAYNVRVIEHKSPFLDQIQPIKSMSDLSSSIARLEQLSSDLSSLSSAKPASTTTTRPAAAAATTTTADQQSELDNNNEANFNLGQYIKQKPAPFKVYGNGNEDDEQDNISLASDCSLRSSRTYHIRSQDCDTLRSEKKSNNLEDDLNDASDFPVESIEFFAQNNNQESVVEPEQEPMRSDKDELEKEENLRAWVFDLRDNSSTAIVAPPRPKEPEVAKVETEELARSRGGRSYYLELIEQEPRKPKVNENLYTRWSSQNALSKAPSSSQQQLQQHQERKSRQSSVKLGNKLQPQVRSSSTTARNDNDDGDKQINKTTTTTTATTATATATATRRQLPFSGGLPPPTLGNRSKSVSCLASSTRPTRYSIYGGFKKPNSDKKPVPRLSYSRAIGPKSQRQIDNQPKTPSRYLKMK